MMKGYRRCVVTKTGIHGSGIPDFCHLCHFSGIESLKTHMVLFNLGTMLNNIEQDEILNKKFVRLNFVHYLCSVQSN